MEKINEEAEQEVTNLKETKIVLKKQLKVLEEKLANSNSENNIEIEDLSAVPTNLEDVFLKMVRENASSN